VPGPERSDGLVIDIDATINIAHSEKKNAAKTWKKTFGFHPLLAYVDRPEVSGGEGLAGILRPGYSGSNTTSDHVEILGMARTVLPRPARPQPGDPDSPQVLVRTDAPAPPTASPTRAETPAAGSPSATPSTHAQTALAQLPEQAWDAAYDIDGGPREGAWVAELTGLLDLAKWPDGSRVIARRERPHPGAQLRFTDVDGHRFTAFITDTLPGGSHRQAYSA
jgi:hypothetical protein